MKKIKLIWDENSAKELKSKNELIEQSRYTDWEINNIYKKKMNSDSL